MRHSKKVSSVLQRYLALLLKSTGDPSQTRTKLFSSGGWKQDFERSFYRIVTMNSRNQFSDNPCKTHLWRVGALNPYTRIQAVRSRPRLVPVALDPSGVGD